MAGFTPQHHPMCRPMTGSEARAWWWHRGVEPQLATLDASERVAVRLQWLLVRWRVDPILCAVEGFRVKLLPYQAQILLDLFDCPVELYRFYGLDPNFPKRQVLSPSGHGLGKTRVLALAIWMHLLLYQYSRTLCTAPSASQLTGRLWNEIRKMHRRLKRFWPLLGDEWEVLSAEIVHQNPDNSDWSAVARTARPEKPEALQGEHAIDDDDHDGQLAGIFGDQKEDAPSGGMMIVIEEASGVDDTIREVLEGALSEHGARLIAPGNPTRPDGWFANDMDKTDRYAVHHLDCRMSNFDQEYSLPYRDTAGQLHHLGMHGLVKPKYWEDLLQDCDGDEDHDRIRVRVRGLKPRSAMEQTLKTHWIDAAQSRTPDQASRAEVPVIGLDFGLTSDKHGLVVRQGFNMVDGEEWLPKDKPDEITLEASEKAIESQRLYKAKYIIGDANGVGRGAMEYLSRYYRERPGLNVTVIHFNSGTSAADSNRYYRRRDEMWFKYGRAWLADSRCYLLTLPGLKAQLTAPGFHEDAKRKIKVETKQEMKKRGVESGNLADALLQTLIVNTTSATQIKPEPKANPVPAIFKKHLQRVTRQQNRRLIR